MAYRIGESTARAIIKETTKAISSVLLPKILQPPSVADFMRISAGFLEKWNFPNCLGSFGGKHCVIQALSRSGSLYHNYKKTFSIVLMAACDSNYKFTLVNIGSYGSQNDAGIFYESEFGSMLRSQKLNVLRKKEKLPGSNETAGYFFIGDEGFPLSMNLMRPYSGRNLNENKNIFNYRLSRARRTIENAFGILVSRWRVLRKPICMHPNTVDSIILSTICLHNFLKSFEEQQSATYNRVYCPPNFTDVENNGDVINGAWRENDVHIQGIQPCNACRATIEAYEQRDKFTNYFLTSEGEIPWQYEYIRRGQNRDRM